MAGTADSHVPTEAIVDFVLHTILANERDAFNYFNTVGTSAQVLLSPLAYEPLFCRRTVTNYNHFYRALILNSKVGLCREFERLCTETKHSHYCLLHVLCRWTICAHAAIDRSTLDVTDGARYKRSVIDALRPVLTELRPKIKLSIDHQCVRSVIATKNPKADLFCYIDPLIDTGCDQ